MANTSIPQAERPGRRYDPPDPASASYMGHDLGAPFHQSFAVRTQRAYFDAESPSLQHQTLARVQRIVLERPQSWLARHWRQIYQTAGENAEGRP